jgi:transcriptional regulator with XRE-family HTH domain
MDPDERGPFGSLLRRVRRARDMTQAELGRIVTSAGPDASETSCAMLVSHYERGLRLPRKERILQLSRALDYPASHFVDAAEKAKLNRVNSKVRDEFKAMKSEVEGTDDGEEGSEEEAR